MSNESLPGNPYITAELEDVARTHSAEASATLALAFEQRTANLIAMTTLVVECLNTKRGIDDESATVLNARLGLNEVQS